MSKVGITYNWLVTGEPEACAKHPELEVFFRLKSTKRKMCIVCVNDYESKQK